MKNTIENIVTSVLIKNRIRNFDKKDLELQLQIHPNYPSFQSVTDTLDYFNIDNIAVEVPIEALDQLPENFISLIKIDTANEIVSVLKKNNQIVLKHTSLDKKNYSLEEFKKVWIPKVIAVEHSSTANLFSKQLVLQNVLIGVLALSILAILFTRVITVSQISFLLLSITGIVFSVLAVRESLGIQSQTMHQFCTSIGSSNCSEVINNKSGKLLDNFSLADAGVVFFSIVTLYQFIYGYNSTLLLPTLVGIPFILYSLYSQAFVVKKWCAICITISCISIGLTVISLLSLPFDFSFSFLSGFILLTTLFTLGYIYFKQYMVASKEYKVQNIKLNQFKRDGQIFNHLLSLSEKIENTHTIANEIVIGNSDAPFKIISLTNPMCGYCKGAFEAYTRVLKTMKDQLQIIIRLKVSLDDMENQATQISLRLLDIYHTEGADGFITAYSEWFSDRTFSVWIKKYGEPTRSIIHKEVLNKQYEWAEKNNLYYTPASILNDTLYPKKYSYDEFFHFTSMMIENQDRLSIVSEEQKSVDV